MKLNATERIDLVNIGLMLFSCIIAIIIPFELFLFSYAILGPLHYLTEISWLHDRQYFTKGKYDALVLLIIGVLVTLVFFNQLYALGFEFPGESLAALTFIALVSALIMVLVKNNFYKIAGIALVILCYKLSTSFAVFLTMFLPTLVHVYIFTGLFMLYGALKSRSKMGLLSVAVLVLCPVILYNVFPDQVFFNVTEYGKSAYLGKAENGNMVGFFNLNVGILHTLFNVTPDTGAQGMEFWLNTVFHSKAGILLARFIAFAYTYHYLNWFSKTRVIQWHKVPRSRFAIVIVFYLISIGLYISNYVVGLQWLFFLSFLHVLLEFPLNYTSVIGIWKSVRERLSPKQETAVAAPVRKQRVAAGVKK